MSDDATWMTFNYGSFMEVIAKTIQTDGGIAVPGNLMPSGKPVTAAGVDKRMLLTDRSLVEQWVGAVKSQYEAELREMNEVPARLEDVSAPPVYKHTVSPYTESAQSMTPVTDATAWLEFEINELEYRLDHMRALLREVRGAS